MPATFPLPATLQCQVAGWPASVTGLRLLKVPVTTDEQLMLDVQRGVREAFEQLFERYRDPMWRFFRRRVLDPARAEELAQDAFVAVLQGKARYEPRAPFRSYLFGIAYNLLQADRRKGSHAVTEPLVTDAVAGDAGHPDTALLVQAALGQLDTDDREILMLREYEQLSYEEIALLWKVPLSTIRSRLFRARLALRVILEQPAQTPGKVTHGSR